jgi:serine/threonine-protein kinase HipA
MNRCPITYQKLQDGTYSKTGIHYFNPGLKRLRPFPYDNRDQILKAGAQNRRIDMNGSKPMIYAQLSIRNSSFVPVDQLGSFILKPRRENITEQSLENEDLTMKLAAACGIETPMHGLIYADDQSRLFAIRRFDRFGKSTIYPATSAAQLSGNGLQASLDDVLTVIDRHCTFPLVERKKLFHRTLFAFLAGVSDLHPGHIVILEHDGKKELSAAFSLKCGIILDHYPDEELYIPLNGKRSGFAKEDILVEFGEKTLGLPEKTINSVVDQIRNALSEWRRLVRISFLNEDNQKAYLSVLDNRLERMR